MNEKKYIYCSFSFSFSFSFYSLIVWGRVRKFNSTVSVDCFTAESSHSCRRKINLGFQFPSILSPSSRWRNPPAAALLPRPDPPPAPALAPTPALPPAPAPAPALLPVLGLSLPPRPSRAAPAPAALAPLASGRGISSFLRSTSSILSFLSAFD